MQLPLSRSSLSRRRITGSILLSIAVASFRQSTAFRAHVHPVETRVAESTTRGGWPRTLLTMGTPIREDERVLIIGGGIGEKLRVDRTRTEAS